MAADNITLFPSRALPNVTVLQYRLQLTLHHASIRCVGNSIDVRWHFMPLLAFVHVNNLLRIDGQILVGIYDNAEETRVCLWDKWIVAFETCYYGNIIKAEVPGEDD